ncbi:MAG: galactitol-1-phosphate 5-dehydrogenase [Synergistaceae bacterium]|jgi:L-iditol 2-dehydrogenase|nr:galactitol-1-phosphate 5-dehydrogenase [Synergistaceae bacterium]
MKALVLTEYYKLEYKEVPTPRPGPGEVLLRVKACAICGSDVHGYDGQSGRRIPPVVMGHEASGVIEETGPEVKAWRKGDRVTFDSTVYCGSCHYCRKGQINLCENRMVLGVSCGDYRRDGAMAEYVVLPERILYRLPDGVSFEQAAMVEPLSIAVHATAVSPLKLGDRAVVLGAGTIGLMLTQTLATAGASQIIVCDLDPGKLELARKLGATHTLTSDSGTAGAIQDITGAQGADIAFEAVGIPATFSLAVNCVHRGGAVVMVGNVTKEVSLPLQKCVTEQIGLYGTCSSSGEYDICLGLIGGGRLRVDELISKTAPLEEGGKWFDRLHAAEPGLIKVVLQPD